MMGLPFRVAALLVLGAALFYGGMTWIERHPICDYGACACSDADGGAP